MAGINYTVVSGDCLSAIAKRFGYQDYRTIYNHPDNASFKQKRPNPNLIYPGDVVVIPDKDQKSEIVSVGSSASFILRGQKQVLRLRLMDSNLALKQTPYSILLKGSGSAADLKREGKFTDSEGIIAEEIPSQYLDGGTADIVIQGMHFLVRLGGLDPIERISGVKQRLKNLGYSVSNSDDLLSEVDVASILLFKKNYNLSLESDDSDEFRKKLCEVHDNNNNVGDFED